MLECVVNVSEGRRAGVIAAIAGAAGDHLLDLHTDADHHRSVLTLAGPEVEAAAMAVVARAVQSIDLRGHSGAHPRLGAVDVVPFVPLEGTSLTAAVKARDRLIQGIGESLGVPCFAYGGPDGVSLPEVRRRAFVDLGPAAGPSQPHPSAGATCVGARPILVAYNLWLAPPASVEEARNIARNLRSENIRTLGLSVGGGVQVSCNLLAPAIVGPADVFDAVAARWPVARAELVGLVPENVLAAVPRHRWEELDLSVDKTIEARLLAADFDGGRVADR